MIKTVLSIVALVFCLVIFPAFKHSYQASSVVRTYDNRTQDNYLRNFEELIKQLDVLKITLKNNPGSTQTQYLAFRDQFKKMEHWLAYLDEDYYVRHINGAPLPKLDHDVPRIMWFEPKGLQHLDELIYDEDTPGEHLTKQIDYLKTHLLVMYERHQNILFQDRFVYESIRRQLVRLYTLGITGFDTPGSVNAVEDCKSSLKGILTDVNIRPELFDPAIINQVEKAISFCQEQADFDHFDRLTFLKTHIDPLLQETLNMQRAHNIELPAQVNSLPVAVNYESTSLFDPDFLNREYYGIDYQRLNIDQHKTENLGKVLFFDPALSANNQMACASCHHPDKGFSDGLPKSRAFDKTGVVERNSPTIINSVYADRYFHDLRTHKLIDQPTHVIKSHAEFNTSYSDIIKKLSASQEYQLLFTEAFPQLKTPISEYSISHAISAYVQSISGFNSPIDQYIRGESDALAEDVRQGFNLFMGKAACATCHFAPTFSGLVPPLYQESESEILGVPSDPKASPLTLDQDLGRYKNGLTKERADIYKHAFKTPTVRNIELTAPYMHNGSYQTLEEVVEFYNSGGGEGSGLIVPYQTLPPDSLHLSEREVSAIIQFMKSLTDTVGMTATPTTLPVIPGVVRGF